MATARTHGGGRSYTEADRQFNREFGARVRALRIQRGMPSPIDLSRHMGGVIDNSNIAGIEKGGYFPKPLKLLALADALGVSVSVLYGHDQGDGDYRAGYRAALADVEHALHDNFKELRQKGQA